ncbi:helix-turn-helix transcriptional regulator [Puniceibacterium confluentis]|uniref:helix-turn-helix transcriptional regulator n=1 Tax=Puniceibacterium confluentis TaxID=1958944 RepID=UPI0011B3AA6E|nr:AlpA family transcriptional regulator [Puniceibacterium confluentis]
MTIQNETDRLLSRDEVEQRFGITKRFLELAVTRGNGPRFVRVGYLVRYTVKDVRAWIADNTHEAGA